MTATEPFFSDVGQTLPVRRWPRLPALRNKLSYERDNHDRSRSESYNHDRSRFVSFALHLFLRRRLLTHLVIK